MMKKPKVLMIGPARSVHGGISGVVNNYYEAGLDKKIELYYIGTMVEGSKLRKLWQAFSALCKFVGKLPFYEIVHVNVASDASFVRKSFFIRLAKLFGKKIVIHQHGGDFEGFYRKLGTSAQNRVQKVLSLGDVFFVLAPAYKAFFEEITNRDDIIVFPDAIQIPEEYTKTYGGQKILFLGRLCREKGIEELLWAMKELHPYFPDAQLYLGGIWEDAELKEQIQGCEEYITYLGWVSGKEKEKYLRESDIFVLPSYFEGQSVAILEAMAHYCAVVASCVGGIPQMIIHNDTGLLVKPKDATDLQRALETVLANPQMCQSMGAHAREKIEREFAMEQNMEKLLFVYQRILQ